MQDPVGIGMLKGVTCKILQKPYTGACNLTSRVAQSEEIFEKSTSLGGLVVLLGQ